MIALSYISVQAASYELRAMSFERLAASYKLQASSFAGILTTPDPKSFYREQLTARGLQLAACSSQLAAFYCEQLAASSSQLEAPFRYAHTLKSTISS